KTEDRILKGYYNDLKTSGPPPRVLRHDRSSGPDAAAGRALSVRRMAARPRGAGLPRRSSGALLLGPIPPDPPGRRSAGHRGDHRGVPSRHPDRKPCPLGREAPAHHHPRAHAERTSPIRLLDAGASAGRRREDRSIHGGAVRSDYADKASSRAGLPILPRYPADGEDLWSAAYRGRMPPWHQHRLSKLSVDRDRKSTRLNSSHGSISYAVFCLKKKKI